jgi:hypothetical protein
VGLKEEVRGLLERLEEAERREREAEGREREAEGREREERLEKERLERERREIGEKLSCALGRVISVKADLGFQLIEAEHRIEELVEAKVVLVNRL